MANKKISELTEKTTFGDDDFLAGTQGTGATDNRKYGKAAIQAAVGGGFVPLSGTEVGSPVTGDIEFNDYLNITSVSTDSGTISQLKFDGGSTSLEVTDGFNDYAGFTTTGYEAQLSITNTSHSASLVLDNSSVKIHSTNSAFKGIEATEYYGANYDDDTYVQKKYVDDNFVPKAPNDGNAYVMKNGTWVDINSL